MANMVNNGTLTDCLNQSLCYYENYRDKDFAQTRRFSRARTRNVFK